MYLYVQIHLPADIYDYATVHACVCFDGHPSAASLRQDPSSQRHFFRSTTSDQRLKFCISGWCRYWGSDSRYPSRYFRQRLHGGVVRTPLWPWPSWARGLMREPESSWRRWYAFDPISAVVVVECTLYQERLITEPMFCRHTFSNLDRKQYDVSWFLGKQIERPKLFQKYCKLDQTSFAIPTVLAGGTSPKCNLHSVKKPIQPAPSKM